MIYDNSHRSGVEGKVSIIQERDNKPVMDKHYAWLFTFRISADDNRIMYSILVTSQNDMQVQISFNMTTDTII